VKGSGIAIWDSFTCLPRRTTWRCRANGHSIDRIAWGPIDLDKTVNDLKTLGVTFSSDTNPRANPACNFVGGNGEESRRPPSLLHSAESTPHRVVYLVTTDGVKVELVQHLEAAGH
jgi:hypothetical protein